MGHIAPDCPSGAEYLVQKNSVFRWELRNSLAHEVGILSKKIRDNKLWQYNAQRHRFLNNPSRKLGGSSVDEGNDSGSGSRDLTPTSRVHAECPQHPSKDMTSSLAPGALEAGTEAGADVCLGLGLGTGNATIDTKPDQKNQTPELPLGGKRQPARGREALPAMPKWNRKISFGHRIFVRPAACETERSRLDTNRQMLPDSDARGSDPISGQGKS
jgi:hypothetical protein